MLFPAASLRTKLMADEIRNFPLFFSFFLKCFFFFFFFFLLAFFFALAFLPRGQRGAGLLRPVESKVEPDTFPPPSAKVSEQGGVGAVALWRPSTENIAFVRLCRFPRLVTGPG